MADSNGINITTTGVLFMNIDTRKATANTMKSVRRGEWSSALLILRTGPSIAPVWNIPWPTINKAIMAIKAGAANPDKSVALLSPDTLGGAKKWKNAMRATITPIEIDSTEYFSRIYKLTATITIANVAHICHVVGATVISTRESLSLLP